MKRLACWLVGHRWVATRVSSTLGEMLVTRYCLRCERERIRAHWDLR